MLNIQIFRHPFVCHYPCSGEISRKSIRSAYPINSLKVDAFLPKWLSLKQGIWNRNMESENENGNGEQGTGKGNL